MSASEKELIRVEDLHKSFGSLQVLKGVTEHVNHGEVVSVIGPSGGGKSTFLRCLNLLETPTSGKIYFEGTDITDKNVDINLHRQKMGMVFQHFNLFPHKTIKENITLAPIKLLGKSKEEADKRAMELLERVGLAEKADSYPSQLSGGQKQRLSIARVFLKNPPILIFDEATSALDNESEQIVQESLEKLAKNRTTFVIAHRLTTIENAEEILMLTDEGIKERGTHEELMKLDGEYARMVKIHSRT